MKNLMIAALAALTMLGTSLKVSSALRKSHPEVNWNDYDQVAAVTASY